MDDAGGIEVIHRGRQRACVCDHELPATPQIRGALQRPVLSALGKPGYLPSSVWVLADSEAVLPRVVRVAQRVSKGPSTAYDHLPEDATFWRAIHPRSEGLARTRSGVLTATGESVRQQAALSSFHRRGRLSGSP